MTIDDSKTYTYEEAFKECLEYFHQEELPAKVVVDKYLLLNENNKLVEKSPDDIHRRLAKEFARIERSKFEKPYSEEFIYSYLKNFSKIICQGSPTTAIGNDHQFTTTSNCYVLESPQDSYGGIHNTDQQITQISKRRGGVGFDISNIRPQGMATKNSSRTTTGIIPFMERFSNSIREVGQSGRRGAMMLTISIHHPQVSDFITVKNDLTKVTGANISVRLSDEFLTALRNNEDYEQRWPITGTPVISKKVSAKSVWMELIKNAHAMAEPGILNWDHLIRESPADCYNEYGFETVSTNPCLPKWATVLTKNGITRLENVNVGDQIWSAEGWTKITQKWSTGINEVFKFQTTGGAFYSTLNHRIVSNGEKIEVGVAENIDTLCGPSVDTKIIPEFVMDGLVLGDGSIHKASNNLIYLCIGEKDGDYFTSEVADLIGKHRPGLVDYAYEVQTNIKPEELPRTYNRSVPERYVYGSQNIVCSFLRGLYSANGSVCGNRITLKASSFAIIRDVQLMLSSIGIRSYFTTNKESDIQFENGNYRSKENYCLNISVDRELFQAKIGFIQKYKNDKIVSVVSNRQKRTFDIIEKELVSIEETFDITVDNASHTFWSNGFNISNCAELPLCKFDSCRLMILNTLSYVKLPFCSEAYFDFEEFYKDAQVLQRLMDDLIDIELEKINRIIGKIEADPEPDHIKAVELNLWKKILRFCESGRRTGSGITALGDTIAALNIKYGSEDSIKFAERLAQTLKFGCYRSSVDMAKELGPFPVWRADLEKDNPFLNRIKDETICLDNQKDDRYIHAVNGHDLWSDMQKYGRRNIALLTNAPTGTVSLLAQSFNSHGTSSGIEPVFMSSFKRRKKITHTDENARIDFVDQNGDKWQEFKVYHPALKAYMELTGGNENESPYYGACANDIDWVNRVKLQAAIQRHIDHSISSTINLPEDISVEKVAEIYETAFKSGCKGMTIYRNNCRTGVLVAETKTNDFSAERPKEVNCNVHHISVKGKKYIVLVGLVNDRPYEIFSVKNSLVKPKVKTGKIVKLWKSYYKAILDDGMEISPLTSNYDENEEAVTRLASVCLRTGGEILELVNQLEKVNGDMTGFAKSVARALKHYIKDGTQTGETCPDCEQESIYYSEGCKKCSNCNYSKCG